METEKSVSQSNTVDNISQYFDSHKINVIPNVLEQHADNAVFQAESALDAYQSSAYNLHELLNEDERLEANIDGLYISGQEGWPHFEKILCTDDYGELFCLAVLAIKSRNSEHFELAFELAADNEELLNAIADAFIWLPFQEVSSYLDVLFQTKKLEKQFVAIAAYAGHREIVEDHLVDALKSNNALLLSRAVLAVAELGKKHYFSIIKPFLKHEDENVQFSACWALTRFGNGPAMEQLKSFLTHPRHGESAIQFIIMQKDIHATVEILRELFKEEETKRLSIFGMGLLGNPNSIDPLIKLMEDEELARVAGEAFSFITGLDLDYENLDQDQPEGYEGGPNDNPKDENIAMDPDEDLPWPNPELITNWWIDNKRHYPINKKYILGREASLAQYQQVLIHGTQKQRSFAALAIAVHQQNEPIFNVKAPAKRQKQLLGI